MRRQVRGLRMCRCVGLVWALDGLEENSREEKDKRLVITNLFLRGGRWRGFKQHKRINAALNSIIMTLPRVKTQI